MTPRPVPVPVSDTTAADLCRDDDVRIARLVMADGPKTDAEYALARRVLDDAARAELIAWRAVDRNYPPDSAEWWDATLRLRDIADAADREVTK